MRVLDLFAGTGSATAAFEQRGHEVVTVEMNPEFKPTVCANILELEAPDLPGPWDFIWASPPCEGFSVAQIGKNWKNGKPQTDTARLGVDLLRKTVSLIEELKPRAFIIENPRAMMRKATDLFLFGRRTVTYCQYGFHYQKPTDLFGGFPPTLRLHPACDAGAPCHEAAPRGSSTGVQGLANSAKRAVLPPALSMAVCMAMENWQGTQVGQQGLLFEQPVKLEPRRRRFVDSDPVHYIEHLQSNEEDA